MKRITLMCAGGMSSSLLETKVRAAIEKMGVECTVKAVGYSVMDRYFDKTDVFLLAPQVRYQLKRLEEVCNEKGIPIAAMNPIDYGRMNGEAILKQALSILNINENII
ncbi:PTS sugar transporter subunit IIB [Clostridium sp. SHJSY1]|uniref:PTS sugar transporter subunit IIB n=1 Tax=Clostridium sp. SHJSY1 TaxID=2942483 RepID=UPI002874E71B|nr:PTS sugar transporter subunit IIB [Clostridium sp. SHJSY1]MDS0524710.1 PTS sugar transporter subunit IIB [Clostridium sp. SHJSY1]